MLNFGSLSVYHHPWYLLDGKDNQSQLSREGSYVWAVIKSQWISFSLEAEEGRDHFWKEETLGKDRFLKERILQYQKKWEFSRISVTWWPFPGPWNKGWATKNLLCAASLGCQGPGWDGGTCHSTCDPQLPVLSLPSLSQTVLFSPMFISPPPVLLEGEGEKIKTSKRKQYQRKRYISANFYQWREEV